MENVSLTNATMEGNVWTLGHLTGETNSLNIHDPAILKNSKCKIVHMYGIYFYCTNLLTIRRNIHFCYWPNIDQT